MEFAVVGLNFKQAGIDLRAKVHFTESQKIEAQDRLCDLGISQGVILSTCNRSEIYFMADSPAQLKVVKDFFQDYFNLNISSIFLFSRFGRPALEHLFRLTMGLESLVVGEDQILGQIKNAHDDARDTGFSKKECNKIFREAITFARMVKRETRASDLPTSVAYLGIQWLNQMLPLKNRTILLVGSGSMGQLALNYLLEADAQVLLANRTYENSRKLQSIWPDLKIIPFEEVPEILPQVEGLVSATASPHLIFREKEFSGVNQPLTIVDLSMPRDVDPSVGDRLNITLGDLDTFQGICEAHNQERKRRIESWLDEMHSAIDELECWFSQIKIHALFESGQRKCEEISDHTMAYILRKTNLKASDIRKIDKVVRSAVKQTMKEALIQVKDQPESEMKTTCIEYLEKVLL